MAKQTINPGTAPTGAGGDTFRSGSAKLQANDDEIYSQLGATAQGVLPAALPVNKGGTGATTAAAARTSLGLGTAATRNVGYINGELAGYESAGLSGYGYGGRAGSIGSDDLNEGLLSDNAKSGFYAPSVGWKQGGVSQFGTVIRAARSNRVYTDIILPYGLGARPNRLVVRSVYSSTGIIDNATIVEQEVYTTKNTVVDANGFIKAASPIARLFADKVELNDEAERQDISFEKLAIGDYLVKGSSGFALEGWYVETPKDANGNVLFSVIYTTLENGDISVKTYKKKFDFETVSIVADLDNPVDITEGRWIDLRLQELPQPEIEISESIAPPDFQPTGLAEAVATVMESYNDTEQ